MTLKTRKPRVRKKTLAGNLLVDIPREEIEKLAYELWESSGRIPGNGKDNWLEAEQILRKKYLSN